MWCVVMDVLTCEPGKVGDMGTGIVLFWCGFCGSAVSFVFLFLSLAWFVSGG